MKIDEIGKLSVMETITKKYHYKTFDREQYLTARKLVEELRSLYGNKQNESIEYHYNEMELNKEGTTLYYVMWSIPVRVEKAKGIKWTIGSFWPLPIPSIKTEPRETLIADGLEKIKEMVNELKKQA